MRQQIMLGEIRYGNHLITFEGELERNAFKVELLNTLTYQTSTKNFTKLIDAKKHFEASITSIFPIVQTKELKEML